MYFDLFLHFSCSMKTSFITSLFILLMVGLNLQAQNNFENGTSPSTYRIFEQSKLNKLEYNHIIYESEDIDVLNYFGNRLEDIDKDGKIDIMMRVQNFLKGDWDYPSGNPRLSLFGNFDKNFNFSLKKTDKLIADGEYFKYFSDETGDYYFQYTFQDPTRERDFGIDDTDWKTFYSKYNFFENTDYFVIPGNEVMIGFDFRIYRVKNGIMDDVTKNKKSYSVLLESLFSKFFWGQCITKGDFDGDGDEDFLVFGIGTQNQNSILNSYGLTNRIQPYFIENLGGGNLKVDIYNFNPGFNVNYGIEEGTYGYASNFDQDSAIEALMELTTWDSQNTSRSGISKNRSLGYFDVNKATKELTFTKLVDKSVYLFSDNWNIGPRFISKLNIDQNRELILCFNTSMAGSPPQSEGVTSFLDGDVQQYFKVFEKVANTNGSYKLIEVTSEFFDLEESKTLSLDNSGRVYYIDVDGDGLIDIYPQLGAGPESNVGGLSQFIKYPSWNNKINTLYYFKQMSNKKFKLTNFFEVPSVYFPANFNSDFSIFDDNGYKKYSDGKEIRVEDFTFWNTVSLNDVNQDGQLDYITANDPYYLSVFTKSKIDLPYEIKNIKLADYSQFGDKYDSGSFGAYNYDFSKIKFPVDSIYTRLDPGLKQNFILIDSEKRITHAPIGYSPFPVSLSYSVKPPRYSFKEKLNANSGQVNIKYLGVGALDTNYVTHTYPYEFRIGNDMFVNELKVSLSNRNIPPLPFNLISAKRVLDVNNNRFEVDFTNSFDINLNNYQLNNVTKEGVRYGYELYKNGVLVENVVVNEVITDLLEPNSNRIKIKAFKIPIGSLKFSEVSFKIFALDNQNNKIKVYADIPTIISNAIFCNPSKPMLNTTKFTFCAVDTLKLVVTNSVKSEKYKWVLGTKIDSSNVTTKVFTESTKLVISKIDSLGCEAKTDTILITKLGVVPPPVISNTSALSFCAGQNVALKSSATINQWYLNGNAITNATTSYLTVNASGIYKVKAFDGDCSSLLSSAATVVVNPIPPMPSITIDANGGLTSSAIEGNQWFFNDVKIDNATQRTYNPTKSGNYTVKVASPCESELSKSFAVTITSTEESVLNQVIISPNPFSNRIRVNFPVEFGQSIQIKVVDISGNILHIKASVVDSELLDISHLSAGNYILYLISNDTSAIKSVKINKSK
jgi:hypothetical protein